MTSASRKCTVLFVTPLWNSRSTFYRWDIEHAQSRFDVAELHYVPGDRRFVDRFARLALQSSAVVCWFTGAYALTVVRLAHMVGRRVVIITGGYDVKTIPSLGFGLKLENEAHYHRGAAALHHADCVFALSKNLDRVSRKAAEPRCMRLVYGGIDTSLYRPLEKESDLVVLVAHVRRHNIALKGVPAVIEAARMIPPVRIVHVGDDRDGCLNELRLTAPPNFVFHGPTGPEEAAQFLGRAKVSLHVSAFEGFGYAIAECMASGCIPVITRLGSMLEIAGPSAEVVRFNDPKSIAAGIVRALARDDGEMFRERAVRMFDAARRREELCDAIEWLTR